MRHECYCFLDSLAHLQQLELDVPVLTTLTPPVSPAPRLTHNPPRYGGVAKATANSQRGFTNQSSTHTNKPRARVAPQIMSLTDSGRNSSDRRNGLIHSHKPSEGSLHYHYTLSLLI